MQRFIPPGGNLGIGQNTLAAQLNVLGTRGGGGRMRRRRRSRKSTAGSRSSRRSRRSSGRKSGSKLRRLVKGSAAARRHMARLRAMRKRK